MQQVLFGGLDGVQEVSLYEAVSEEWNLIPEKKAFLMI